MVLVTGYVSSDSWWIFRRTHYRNFCFSRFICRRNRSIPRKAVVSFSLTRWIMSKISATSTVLHRRLNRLKLNITSIMGTDLGNRNRCYLQNSGFRFQELKNLIFSCKTFIIHQKNARKSCQQGYATMDRIGRRICFVVRDLNPAPCDPYVGR
jgi:hypothetical protein